MIKVGDRVWTKDTGELVEIVEIKKSKEQRVLCVHKFVDRPHDQGVRFTDGYVSFKEACAGTLGVLYTLELYQVSVVYENTLEELHQFLTNTEAEELFLSKAEYWYDSDGVASFKVDKFKENVTLTDTEKVDLYKRYYCSGSYHNSCDGACVVFEKMKTPSIYAER